MNGNKGPVVLVRCTQPTRLQDRIHGHIAKAFGVRMEDVYPLTPAGGRYSRELPNLLKTLAYADIPPQALVLADHIDCRGAEAGVRESFASAVAKTKQDLTDHGLVIDLYSAEIDYTKKRYPIVRLEPVEAALILSLPRPNPIRTALIVVASFLVMFMAGKSLERAAR